jgi:hypothetical protein
MTDLERLNAMVARTAKAMRVKLHAKWAAGYRGWDDTAVRGVLGRKLREHVERAAADPEQWLDVCNLAAMLYDGRKRDPR